MTADPWDLPTLTHEPLLTMEEYEAIQAEVKDSPWLDPTRYQECLEVAMDALRSIGCVTVSTPPEVTATQGLRRIARRAISAVPFNEPCEPAWSLDPEERHVPGSERR